MYVLEKFLFDVSNGEENVSISGEITNEEALEISNILGNVECKIKELTICPIVSEIGFRIITTGIENNTSIEILIITGNKVVNIPNQRPNDIDFETLINKINGFPSLSSALKNNSHITELKFYSQNVREDGALHLADALDENNTITHLFFDHCDFSDGPLENLLSKDLNNIVSLTLKNYHKNKLGGPRKGHIIQRLFNLNLERLEFRYCSRDTPPPISLHIKNGLMNNTRMIELDIRNNFIGNEGAKDIADALQTNTTLAVLDLSNNLIGNEGLKYITDALRDNITLAVLNISNNLIGDEDIQEIINGLRQNTTLARLDLQKNNMNEDTIIEFTRNNPPNRQLLIN